MKTKICALCKIDKPYDQYRMRSGNRSHQPHAYCLICEKEYRKEHNKKYFSTEEGRAARKKYFDSPKGKEMKARADKKYSHTEKGKQARKRASKKYLSTEDGRIKTNKAARERRGENISKAREYDRLYYRKNSEYYKLKSRRYYIKNKNSILKKQKNNESRKKYERNWRIRNKNKVNAAAHKRRSIVKNLSKHYTAKQWEKLCDEYNNKCLCCGNGGKLTVDHIVPLSQGGTNTIDNIQPLCLSCNCSKGINSYDYR